MNSGSTIIDRSLNRATARWKGLRLLQHTCTLGCVLCLLALGFAVLLLRGWVSSQAVAVSFFASLAILGFLAWLILLLAVLSGVLEHRRLAAAYENIEPRLLDRLNTLVHLERPALKQPGISSRPRAIRPAFFAARIRGQAAEVLSQGPATLPFGPGRALLHCLAFIVTLTATVLVYELYAPLDRLTPSGRTRVARTPAPDKPLELALPTNNVEAQQPWGEVRITDPDADLKLTKVDVLPLQIEAAANQSLREISWSSAINGAAEVSHALPPPAEPRYAVYQPTLYLDELRLADWDVMTYYAKAATEKSNTYASKVYFVEVRPFREDILKMPGGEQGQAYQALSEMSSLVERQEHVIRQTYQHVQNPPEQANLQKQDREKLSEAEADLGESAQHLYARMAGEMENKPIGAALDNLAKAQQALEQSSRLLANNTMPEAQNQERAALTDLVAARKVFQKSVSDHPNDFGSPGDGESSPVAEPSKQLKEIAEFSDEAKAAREFVEKAAERQQHLQSLAHSSPRSTYPGLADQEQQLQKSLEDFESQHPRAFQGTEEQSQGARDALAAAGDALRRKTRQAGALTDKAAEQLTAFRDALQGHSLNQQLADAYRLKHLLDDQIHKMDQAAQPNSNVASQDVQKSAGVAQQTLNQLQKAAEQEPTRGAFGQPLRDALSGTNKSALDDKLNALSQGADSGQRQQQLAGEARDALGQVSNAFSASQPRSLQMARQSDALKPAPSESFDRGMSELDSLLQQMERGRPLAPEERDKQSRQALSNLDTALSTQFADNEAAAQLLLHLRETMKSKTPLETADLKALMDQLQKFSVENSERLARRDDPPQLSNIDPSRLPPAYRGRIQKYFEKLSER